MKRKDEGKRWFDQAKEDLKSAEYLFKGERYYLVCFLSQQIAEKALKAFLYSEGEDLVLGRSVEELCEWTESLDQDFKDLREKVAILDSYYIPTRYPNALPSSIPAKVFNEKTAKDALELARETVNFVENRLK